MSDRTPDQINQTLDRLLEVSAETSRNIDRLEAAIEQTNTILQDFIQSAKNRILSLETSREQEEEKVENLQNEAIRLGRADLEHQAKLDRMDGIIARYDRMHLEHQARIDRQDRLIELLSRRGNTDTDFE